ncbi:MAG: hypothetical protein ACRCZF_27165 [Gemmataceae bacterium]
MTGRHNSLSTPRVWMTDLMHAAAGTPIVTFRRTMMLADLVAARQALADPPSWVVLFVKAYSIVARRRPELRRAYVRFPWARLYQADDSIASVAIEREYEGESAVFFGLQKAPETVPLQDLHQRLVGWKTRPIDDVQVFQKLLRFTRLPRPLRRALWWYAMHTSGRKRARNFGTFGISITASLGATAVNLISPLTSTLHYGPLQPDGQLEVFLHFDHRVLDGAPVARALVELEQVLRTEILAELQSLARPAALLPPRPEVNGQMRVKSVQIVEPTPR